jgi:hypothetical protein
MLKTAPNFSQLRGPATKEERRAKNGFVLRHELYLYRPCAAGGR